MRSWRRAARKVSVRQWPCGALPISRWPRGPQPRSGAMLVFAQVSSMKTKRLGSMLAWRARHLQRRLATSGRSCSAAKAVFFEAEPLGVEEIPHRLPPHLDTPRRSEEHTSELQSLMRISYAVFCLKTQKKTQNRHHKNTCK